MAIVSRKPRHKYHSLYRRALYSFILVISVLLIGTVLFHYVQNYSYVDAFYFMSMIATAQGPAIVPSTVAGKLLTSFMAFISIGSVIFALGFIFGPFFGRLLKIGEEKFKEEEEVLEKDMKKLEKK